MEEAAATHQAPVHHLLELHDVCYSLEQDGEQVTLLDRITLSLPSNHFMAVVGPSGCGKSSLLKIITGIWLEDSGKLFWRGQDLGEAGELLPTELGYVPQFSIAYEHLTVEESVEMALKLRARSPSEDAFFDKVHQVISAVGLEEQRELSVAVLSGGQRRRLGLAMELVSDPTLLLCDEVTSGLDAKSEAEIVHLMHQLSRLSQRAVVNVTHSLANMELYDSILVLHEGRVAFHGPATALLHYFSIQNTADMYPQLAQRSGAEWHESWQKRREAYYAKLPISSSTAAEEGANELPGPLAQMVTLLGNRIRLFFRDKTQLALQCVLLIIFPLLVVIFAPQGLDAFPDEVTDPTLNYLEQARQTAFTEERQTKLGALVSGLVMFQVILLTLMGSNNAAREIAGERLVYEKMRLSGVRPASYVASKLLFLGFLVLLQSSIMAQAVHLFCRLPGSFGTTWLLLVLVNAGMTAVCLAISANLRSADQASLLSVYLVGFQLPLSGAILKLPSWLEPITQPIIAAYWSWAGQLQSIGNAASPYYQGVRQAIPTFPLPTPENAIIALLGHVLVGVALAYIGCRRLLLPRE
jgi:ABC transport system ATP-binding/permease protein